MNIRFFLGAALCLALLSSVSTSARAQNESEIVSGVPAAKALALAAVRDEDAVSSLWILARSFNSNITRESLRAVWSQQVDAPSGNSSPSYLWARLTAASHRAQLPFVARQIKTRDVARSGPALVYLEAPTQVAVVRAVGREHVLLWAEGRDVLMPFAIFVRRFSGHALINVAPPALHIENAVREVHLTTIGGSSEVVQSIRLHNTSTRPLAVRVVSTSCGCTGAQVSPASLAPGASGVLVAKMHVNDSRLVTIGLATGDTASPQAVAALQTRVPEGVTAPPVLLLNTMKGEAAATSATITLPRGARVVKVSTPQPWLVAAPSPTTAVSNHLSHVRIEAHISPQAPAGRFESAITLFLSNSPVQQIVMPVMGMISDDVIASPPALVLGARTPGTTIRKTVIVRGPRPFSITSITSGAKVQVQADPKVVATAHAVEIATSINGPVGQAVFERVILLLSDQRTLNIDIFGSIDTGSKAQAQELPEIEVGMQAPDFVMADAQGTVWRLSDMRGQKNVLLTFFPKCFTGGCANHLSSLRDVYPTLQANDTQGLAVSVDPAEGEKGQKEFAKQWNLPFPLIPDTERKISLLYGAVEQPTDLDRRMTVLIDKQGIVRFVDTSVNVQTHGADMVAKMRELGMIK